jgi:hypothetical protein
VLEVLNGATVRRGSWGRFSHSVRASETIQFLLSGVTNHLLSYPQGVGHCGRQARPGALSRTTLFSWPVDFLWPVNKGSIGGIERVGGHPHGYSVWPRPGSSRRSLLFLMGFGGAGAPRISVSNKVAQRGQELLARSTN